jgi:hypothetical protein
MKKRILWVLLGFFVGLLTGMIAHAEGLTVFTVDDEGLVYMATYEDELDYFCKQSQSEPILIGTTAYTVGDGHTPNRHFGNGDPVREGGAAGMVEWRGLTVAVDLVAEDGGIGEFVGYFEILDSAGVGTHTREGRNLDIYRSNIGRCWEWMRLTHSEHFGGSYVYIEFFQAEG